MSVSYKKLWKLLIDKNMIKKQLREQAGLTTNVIAKLGKDENVSTEVLCKICKALDCGLDDIIEIIREHSHKRKQFVPSAATYGVGSYTSFPVEVSVGGATIFVTDIERFEKV